MFNHTYIFVLLLMCALSAFSMGMDPFYVSFCLIAVATAVFFITGGSVLPQIAILTRNSEASSPKRKKT